MKRMTHDKKPDEATQSTRHILEWISDNNVAVLWMITICEWFVSNGFYGSVSLFEPYLCMADAMVLLFSLVGVAPMILMPYLNHTVKDESKTD